MEVAQGVGRQDAGGRRAHDGGLTLLKVLLDPLGLTEQERDVVVGGRDELVEDLGRFAGIRGRTFRVPGRARCRPAPRTGPATTASWCCNSPLKCFRPWAKRRNSAGSTTALPMRASFGRPRRTAGDDEYTIPQRRGIRKRVVRAGSVSDGFLSVAHASGSERRSLEPAPVSPSARSTRHPCRLPPNPYSVPKRCGPGCPRSRVRRPRRPESS